MGEVFKNFKKILFLDNIRYIIVHQGILNDNVLVVLFRKLLREFSITPRFPSKTRFPRHFGVWNLIPYSGERNTRT